MERKAQEKAKVQAEKTKKMSAGCQSITGFFKPATKK